MTGPVFLPGVWQNLLMEPLDVFTAQDLARRPEDLFRDAEQGKLSLITKDGRPAMVAVPFDERLLDLGIHRTMAVHLFESGQTTLSQSARIADVPLVDFIEILGRLGIPVVDYPPEELEQELEVLRAR
jgi:predicted HTH domain antitoxin